MMRRSTAWIVVAPLLATLATACGGTNLFTEPGASDGDGDARGAIVGRVSSAGVGMGDVQIVLVERDSTRTNGQGQYRFGDLAAATYTVSIRVPLGFELAPGDSTSVTRTVAGGGEARADWTLLATGPVTAAAPLP